MNSQFLLSFLGTEYDTCQITKIYPYYIMDKIYFFILKYLKKYFFKEETSNHIVLYYINK